MKIKLISLLLVGLFTAASTFAEDQVTAIGSTIVYTDSDGVVTSLTLDPGESFPSDAYPAPEGQWSLNSVEGEARITIGGVTVTTQAGAKVNFSANALGEIGFTAVSGSATVSNAGSEVMISSDGTSFASAFANSESAPVAGDAEIASTFSSSATFADPEDVGDATPAAPATSTGDGAAPSAPAIPAIPSIDVPSNPDAA